MVRDKIVSWFIRNYLLPRAQIISYPSFVAFDISYKTRIYIRQFILPESIFVKLEKKLYKNTDKNSNFLYTTGKKFGYRFADLSNTVTIKDVSEKRFLEFAKIVVKFVEGTYSSGIDYEINLDEQTIKFKIKDFIICRNSGIGYLFSTGGIAGIWSFALQNPEIEAVQPKCQGRGDTECEVVVAPYDTLVKMGYKPLKFNKLEKLEIDNRYLQMNKIRPTKWAKHSLKSLIDSGFFKYAHGQVMFKEERFFLVEASLMYILEKELKKLKDGLNVLWDASFGFGEDLAKKIGKQNPAKFIMDFFPALGFGDIFVKGSPWKVMVNYFPWTKWADEIDFVMFRGILSGVISELSGKQVKLKKVKKYISGEGFSLTIEE